MYPSQSSIYRDLELMMLWYLPIGRTMPKDQSLQNIGNFFQSNLLEAMTACAVALQTKDKGPRLELIGALMWHLSLCNSAVSMLYEYSCSKEKNKEKKDRVITVTQFENYLERKMSLKKQIAGWEKKTASES